VVFGAKWQVIGCTVKPMSVSTSMCSMQPVFAPLLNLLHHRRMMSAGWLTAGTACKPASTHLSSVTSTAAWHATAEVTVAVTDSVFE